MRDTLVKLIFIILMLITLVANARSAEIDDKRAVRAIIGEAGNQGYQGMLAVAVGIRNRGTLTGVYGVNASHVDSEPVWVWKQAAKAWEESKHNKIHSGDHWENINAFGKPAWADSMTAVYQYKDHVFYRR